MADEINGRLPDFLFAEVEFEFDATGGPYCNYDDCYMFMPGMSLNSTVGRCTMGLAVTYPGGLGIITAEHCSGSSYDVKSGGSPVRVYATSYKKNNHDVAADYQIYDISESTRSGRSDRNTLNFVLTGPKDHSNVLSGVVRTYEGEWLCKTAWKSQQQGHNIECGSVTDMGDLAPGLFSYGLIKANLYTCEGDSGGPVWASRSGTRYAVGFVATGRGIIFSGPGYRCYEKEGISDGPRGLSDLSASFFNPGGTETSRRAALRYYDILFNREADNSGFYYYDASCSLSRMRNYAYIFSVSQNAEFANRFPLSGSSASSNAYARVRRIYYALLDRAGSYSEIDYWRDYIYGSSSSTTSARESRYDYFAWLVIDNPTGSTPEFSTSRMSNTGPNGAPPMCNRGW